MNENVLPQVVLPQVDGVKSDKLSNQALDELEELKSVVNGIKKVFERQYQSVYGKRYYWTEDGNEKRRENQRQYYIRNRERILSKANERYRKANGLVAEENQRVRKNSEELKSSYYERNREKILKQMREKRMREKELLASIRPILQK